MSQILNAAIAVVGIDIGKNSFHIVGHDERGAIVLRQKWSRGQVSRHFEGGQVQFHTAEVTECYSVFKKWDFARKTRAKSKSNLRVGAQGRNRTTDTAIFNRMLYQLSYLGAVRST